MKKYIDCVWFSKNIKERNKILRKIIFSCLVLLSKIRKKYN